LSQKRRLITFILNFQRPLCILFSVKIPRKRKKLKPRLPLEAVLRLRSHPVTTEKGKKGYDRQSAKKETKEIVKQNPVEEKN